MAFQHGVSPHVTDKQGRTVVDDFEYTEEWADVVRASLHKGGRQGVLMRRTVGSNEPRKWGTPRAPYVLHVFARRAHGRRRKPTRTE
jgi:hypothetical protein